MELYLKTKDYAHTKEEFQLHYDNERDMLITHPQPSNIEAYYQSDAYISHTDANKSLADKLYQYVKKYSLKKKGLQVEAFAQAGKRVLDIGAGTGDFLKHMQLKGWQVHGVEPNHLARKAASIKGLHLESNLDKLAEKKFNSITLWHVLEHLPDLEQQIRKLETLLENEGTLFVAVPNYKSFDATYYGKFWAGFDVPRHLWHFSRASIQKVFAKSGMKIVDIQPMIFDAYYISLLSEKYKSNRTNFVKAFMIGMRSNLKARKTKEYSSLLYIIKRA